MPFAAGLALALSAVVTPVSGTATAPAPMPTAQSVHQYVETYFANEPVMISIAECESNFRQFDKDGQVLKNSEGSSAVGVFQILSSVHDSTAGTMGLDIDTLEGNVAYAQHLYQEKGTEPWKSSESCWSKPQSSGNLALK
jgi:hypothetical protein